MGYGALTCLGISMNCGVELDECQILKVPRSCTK